MNFIQRFLSIVPKQVKIWASVAVGCIVLIGLVAAYRTSEQGALPRTMAMEGTAALVFGLFAAIWLLCLGFVFADAQRRNMRAILWVLVAMFFPHLLGFLLYFVLRQPIAAHCMHCGATISHDQRFCSGCGRPVVSSSHESQVAEVSREASQ